MRKFLTIVAAMLLGVIGFRSYAADYPGVSCEMVGDYEAMILFDNAYTLETTGNAFRNVSGYQIYFTGTGISDKLILPYSSDISEYAAYGDGASFLYVDFTSLNLGDGNYTMVIPAGYLKMTTSGGQTIPDQEYQFTITIGDGEGGGGDTDVPTYEGVSCEMVGDYEAMILFDNAYTLDTTGNASKNVSGYQIYFTGTGISDKLILPYSSDISEYSAYGDGASFLYVDFTSLNLGDGNYIMVIPAGYLTMTKSGGQTIPDQEYQFAITIGEGGGSDTPVYDGISFTQLSNSQLQISWADGGVIGIPEETSNNTNQAYVTNGVDKYYINYFWKSATNCNPVCKDTYNSMPCTMTFDISSLNLAEGNYTLVIPKDYVNVVCYSGVSIGPNPQLEYEFTITPDLLEGKLTQDGTDLILTFDDGVEIEGLAIDAGTTNRAYIVLANNQRQNIGTSFVSVMNTAVTFSLGSFENLKPGTYTLVVPANYLMLTNAEGKATSNAAQEFTFTIEATQPDVPYEYTLELNTTNEWYVKFKDLSSIAAGTGTAYLESASGAKFNLVFASSYSSSASLVLASVADFATFNGLRVYLERVEGLTGGDYTLVLPAGFLKINGVATASDIRIEGLEYDAPPSYEYTLELNTTNEWYVKFKDLSSIAAGTGTAYLESASGAKFNLVFASSYSSSASLVLASVADFATFNGLRVYLERVEGLTGGDYTLVLPAGFLKINGAATASEIRIEGLEYDAPSTTPNYTVSETATNKWKVTFTDATSVDGGTGEAYLLSENDMEYTLTFSSTYSTTTNIVLDSGYPNAFRLQLDFGTPVLETGTYTLVLPAGYLKIDGVATTSEIRIEGFEYVAPTSGPTYTITAQGGLQWNVGFDGVNTIAKGTGTPYLANGSGVKVVDLSVGDSYSNDNIVFTQSWDSFTGFRLFLGNGNLNLSSGTYSVVFPAGSLIINGSATTTEIVVSSFVIEMEGYAVAETQTMSTSYSNDVVSISWSYANNARVLSFTKQNCDEPIQIIDANGSVIPVPDSNVTFVGNESRVEVNVSGLGLTLGNSYQISIPEGLVLLATYNPDYDLLNKADKGSFTYANIGSSFFAEWEPGPWSYLTDNKTVSVTWGDYTYTHIDGAPEVQAKAWVGGGYTYVTLAYGNEVTINGSQIDINLKGLAPDTWEIDVPQGYVSFKANGVTYVNAAAVGGEYYVEEYADESTVTFYFQDGEEDGFEIADPKSYVAIWNESVGDWGEGVTITGNPFEFPYVETTKLRIYPKEFDFEVVVTAEGANEGTYLLEQDETEWYLTIYPEADGLEVTVKVYLEGSVPGGEAKNVTLSFNIDKDSGVDPTEAVTISYFDTKTSQNVELEIEDYNAQAAVPAGSTVTIAPKRGYFIAALYPFDDEIDEKGIAISQPSDFEGEWMVAVAKNPSVDFAAFFIYLEAAPASVEFNFTTNDDNIYGNPEDFVTFDPDDVADFITGNDNKIYIAEEGWEFTMSAVPGYEIASLVVTDADGNAVALADLPTQYGSNAQMNADGSYSFSLFPAASGLVFTFDIETNIPGVDIEFNFTGSDDLEDSAYTYVQVVLNALTYLDVTGNTFTYEVPNAVAQDNVELEFIPETGYELEVSCVDAQGDEYGDVMTSEGSATVQLSIPVAENGTTIPEGLTVTVDVAKAGTQGVNGIVYDDENDVIFNLQGIRIYADELTPGIYIINGKKVLVRE